MKSFKSYLKEYGALDPFQPMGGSSSGPGMGQYVPTADLNLRASKQAVSGGKVAKFITGNNVNLSRKKYKKVELEVLKVDNKSQTVEVAFISPKELENRKVNMSFRYLRRGPFVATKIPNYFEAVEKYLIYQRGRGVGKTARIVMKNIKDINTARKWIKDNGHSFDHKGKNFQIYKYTGSPNNIKPDDLVEDSNPRIPRKKGQPAGSKKHSDLYTDENQKVQYMD